MMHQFGHMAKIRPYLPYCDMANIVSKLHLDFQQSVLSYRKFFIKKNVVEFLFFYLKTFLRCKTNQSDPVHNILPGLVCGRPFVPIRAKTCQNTDLSSQIKKMVGRPSA
jgi:hypothetical protein